MNQPLLRFALRPLLRRPPRLLCLAGVLALAACSSNEGPVETTGRPNAPDEPADTCNESGHACTWLGLPGESGFNGDGHRRQDTMIYWSMDMAFGQDGSVWFIDWNNHMVRRVLADQTVETVLGDPSGFPGDGNPDEGVAPEGVLGTTVGMNHPTDLAFDTDGTLLVMAWHNHKLRKLDPVTLMTKIECGGGAGFRGDGGAASQALFRQPKALVLGAEGERYILDQQNYRIRMIDTADIITTLAGTGTPGDGSAQGDGGLATLANLNFAGGSNPEPSGGLVRDGNRLYFSDTLAHRIRSIDLETRIIDTYAGTGESGYSGDQGPALLATLNHPRDLEIGPEGDLYFADTDNSVIRAISAEDGSIRTVAGTGELGLDPNEGRLATETLLARPFSIDFDPEGNLFISDTINSRIVRVQR